MKRRAQRGSILIVVLWACIGLVSVALMFGHSMLMTYRGADYDVSGRQADQAIEGAARYVEALEDQLETPGQFPDSASYQSEDLQVGEASVWILGRSAEAGAQTNATRTYGLVDESGKINLNTASAEMLKGIPGMTEEFAAAIVDWRDTDDEITENGAESQAYLSRSPSYACKNGPFESIEELALVSGATREILYGEDANMNGVLDPNEDDGSKSLPADNADGKLDAGILDYVTVFSKEPLLDADGTARININVIPLPEALWTKVAEVLGADTRARIQLQVGVLPCQSVLQFYVRSGLTEDEFAKISGFLTTSTAAAPRNAINVNTASEAVLACVPGIGTDKASSLVAARLSRAGNGTNIDWLKEALGQDAAQVCAELTIWSYQVSADIAAVGHSGRGYRRTRFVIDQSTGSPRIIYRRNLAPLGWALGSEIRQSLATRKESL